MAVVIAKWLGPGGRVYATDIREAELAEIRAAVAREGLANVVVPGGCHEFDEAAERVL